MCLYHLTHKWHKWHKYDNDHNLAGVGEMFRKLKSRIIRVWRFQICNQIIQIDNIFVDIRYSIV